VDVTGGRRVRRERAWTEASPFGQPAAQEPDGITATERQLLRLLLDGHTDESAARRLGVSLRTVRRIMAGLTRRLGARSRFQAGAFAQARGWL
jgi:DNA-binding NarL/FixJ family response regulator